MPVRPVTGQDPIGVRSPEYRRRQPITAESFGGPPDTQRDLSPADQKFLDQYNFQQAELDAQEAAGLAPSREGQDVGGPLQGISDVYTPVREYQLPDWLPPELQFYKDVALPMDSAELGMASLFGGRVPFPGLPRAVTTPVAAAVKGAKPWLAALRRLVTGGGEVAAKGDVDLADIAKLATRERPVIPMNPKVTTEDLMPRDRPTIPMKPTGEDYVPSPEATFHGMTGERLTPYTPSPEAKFHGMTGEPLTGAGAADAAKAGGKAADLPPIDFDALPTGHPAHPRRGLRRDDDLIDRYPEGYMPEDFFMEHTSNIERRVTSGEFTRDQADALMEGLERIRIRPNAPGHPSQITPPVSGGSGAKKRPTLEMKPDAGVGGVKRAFTENPHLADEFREAAIRDVKPIEVTDAHRSIGKDIYVNTDAAFSIGNRPVMLVRRSDGTLQPFYKSTGTGTSPETKGVWLPFDGVQSTTGRLVDPTKPSGGVGIGRGWFIKKPEHRAGSSTGAADVHPREWLNVEDRAISERLSAVERIERMDWDALPSYEGTQGVNNEVEQINRLLGILE